MATPMPELELDNQLCFALYDASRAVVRAYGPLLAELGLTYPQYLTMLVLWESDQPVSVGDLGDRLHLDSGTLSPLVKRLERLGLVARRRDSADERRVLVSLTTDGESLRQQAACVPGKTFERFGLDIAAARTLLQELTRLAAHLDHTSTV